jgi:hypothetical protein
MSIVYVGASRAAELSSAITKVVTLLRRAGKEFSVEYVAQTTAGLRGAFETIDATLGTRVDLEDSASRYAEALTRVENASREGGFSVM